MVYVPVELVFQALTAQNGGNDLLRLDVRSIKWSEAIDHRVTSGHMFVGPARDQSDRPDKVESAKLDEGGPPRRKRYRKPEDLYAAAVATRAAAQAADKALVSNPYALLESVHMDVDAVAEAITASAVCGREAAEAEYRMLAAPERARRKSRWKNVRQARKRLLRARAAVSVSLRARKANTDASRVDALHEALRAADKEKRAALSSLLSMGRILEAGQNARDQKRAPKRFWRSMAKAAVDEGAPPPPLQKLLQRLTDKKGNLISTNRDRIVAELRNDRQKVHSLRYEMLDHCETNWVDSMAFVHTESKRWVQESGRIDARSAVALAATEPERPLNLIKGGPDADQRRARLRALLGAAIERIELEGDKGATRSPGRAVKAAFPQAVRDLNSKYTVEEVLDAMSKMHRRDTGVGEDRLEPVLLGSHTLCGCVHCASDSDAAEVGRLGDTARGHLTGAGAQQQVDSRTARCLADENDMRSSGVMDASEECMTAKWACALFNQIGDTGLMPESWDKHRLLLHYKGKRSDPHCADNYRGLGIDQALLKLHSLVMLPRLNKFLTDTGGLSVAQGGFQRQMGTPEQVFVLTETVRAAVKRGPAQAIFIDLSQAYDSVLHSILFARCLDKGIDGRFLAQIQAIYRSAVGVLEVDGCYMEPVPIECGVLQGNPLSPALFNIYLDGAIRELEAAGRLEAQGGGLPFGLPLPRVQRRGQPSVMVRTAEAQRAEQDDYLSCIFFADDGVLIAWDIPRLQLMLDIMVAALAKLGLQVNVRKTKHMMVVRSEIGKTDDAAFFAERTALTPLRIGDEVVETVDEFEYLGVRLNWRWDWETAWEDAIDRAATAFGIMRRAGWQHRGGSLHSLLMDARAKILCHFTYISALTGAGGLSSSAPWKRCDDVVTGVLQTIGGCNEANGFALAAEAGLWDQQTRIDALLLRFWCKLCTAPIDSLRYRTLCLSVRQLYSEPVSLNDPERSCAQKGRTHRQPWAQQLVAAATRFGLDVGETLALRPTALLQLETTCNGASQLLPHPLAAADEVRAAASAAMSSEGSSTHWIILGSHGQERVEGVNTWTVASDTPYACLAQEWVPALHDACYGAIRRCGNRRRQELVRTSIQAQLDKSATGKGCGLRRWAMMVAFSFEQPYWHVSDVRAARRLLQQRLDMGPYEDYARRRPHRKTRTRPYLHRLDRQERWCYLCGHVHAGELTGGHLDTLEHVAMECTHPDLARLRADVKARLAAMVTHCAKLTDADAPDMTSDTAVLVTLLQCNRVGPVTQEQGTAIWSIPFDLAAAKGAANWVHALTAAWVDSKRYFAPMSHLAVQGRALCDMAGSWALDLCRIRRHALKNNVEYASRLRDPPGRRVATDDDTTNVLPPRRHRKSDLRRLHTTVPTTSQQVASRHKPASKRRRSKAKQGGYDSDAVDTRMTHPAVNARATGTHTPASDPASAALAPHVVRNPRWKVP
jgi:hypothetical protein